MQNKINKLFTKEEETLLATLIGKKLGKVRHDAYFNSNISFRKVSFFVAEKIFLLLNTLEEMDFMWDGDGYEGEEVAVFKFLECNEEVTKENYGFDNLQFIDIPVHEIIKDIIIIEDNVKAYDSNTKEFVSEYDYVKGVVFVFDGFKYCFSRCNWFLEDININKGENPETKIGNINDDWEWGENRYSINTRIFRSLKKDTNN